MKCKICNNEIQKTFLNKILGTYVKVKKNEKNELIPICKDCQKKGMDYIKEKI
ncbi:MAG: hypothetical protein PHT94_00060 [Candidatus Nanoarchaeia archaeon]|nr:hypothetical protein [Candidatus Nanoarchaeia archaeon]